MELPTLQNRRERKLCIYKIVNHFEKTERQDLVLLKEMDLKSGKNQCFRDINKYSFISLHKLVISGMIEMREEVGTSSNINILKVQLDNYKYGNRT